MCKDVKILIVGAGAAGFAAATRLYENGFKNITILEAQNRIGGRIHTVEFSENKIDLGAQWVHGQENNIVYSLASPHDLLSSSTNLNNNNFIFATASGEILPNNLASQLRTLYYEIDDLLTEDKPKPGTSFGNFFVNKFYEKTKNNENYPKDKLDQILDWLQKYDSSYQACDSWFDVSASRLSEYWDCEGDQLLNWKTNGYSTLFDLLMKRIPDPKCELFVHKKIIFNKEVSLIDYTSNNLINVLTKDGSKYKAHHVIVTASLGFLKENHEKLFKPSLPEIKQRFIQASGFGVVNKIVIEFPVRWWPENGAGFGLLWSNEDKKRFQKNFSPDLHWLCDLFSLFTVDYQPRVLLGWITGPSAKYMEKLSDEKVLSDVFLLLNVFLKHVYDIPRPSKIARSSWHSNRFFRGSYSYQTLNAETLGLTQKDLSEPIGTVKPVVLFAGEATHPHYYSTVHGAVETGYREADRIISYYKYISKL